MTYAIVIGIFILFYIMIYLMYFHSPTGKDKSRPEMHLTDLYSPHGWGRASYCHQCQDLNGFYKGVCSGCGGEESENSEKVISKRYIGRVMNPKRDFIGFPRYNAGEQFEIKFKDGTTKMSDVHFYNIDI